MEEEMTDGIKKETIVTSNTKVKVFLAWSGKASA